MRLILSRSCVLLLTANLSVCEGEHMKRRTFISKASLGLPLATGSFCKDDLPGSEHQVLYYRGKTMADAIQFALTDEQMAHFLTWRAQVEAETGNPIEGVVFSFLVTSHGLRQILIRPSTDRDFKLKGVARIDGTYDTFAPHEEV